MGLESAGRSKNIDVQRENVMLPRAEVYFPEVGGAPQGKPGLGGDPTFQRPGSWREHFPDPRALPASRAAARRPCVPWVHSHQNVRTPGVSQ